MKKKIVSVLGDWYHDHDLMKDALDEAIRLFNCVDDIDIKDISIEELPEMLKEKPDLIILGKENRLTPEAEDGNVSNWMTPALERSIVDYVAEGGSWFVWHSGLASYPENGTYSDIVRGYFKHHPPENIPVRYVSESNNAVTGKTIDFEVPDEHYFVECDTENTHVFLRAESSAGNSPAAWAHSCHKGRVCFLAPSHRTEGLLHPVMSELLYDMIQWCCWK